MPKILSSIPKVISLVIPLVALVLKPISGMDHKSTEGFYKSIFRDGGIGLDTYQGFFAAESLGLSFEHLATSNLKTTTDRIVGTPGDSNGVLLYPDGSPRFRLLFVNGGNSDAHGDALQGEGHKRIQDFYRNGGSYSGACAGAHLATLSTTLPGIGNLNPSYFHLWPGRSHYTQLNYEGGTANYTSFKIPSKSPLWNYYDFGPDSTVEKVFHNGGSFVIEDDNFFWAPGTEILATYEGPITYSNDNVGRDVLYQGFFGYGGIWAHKQSDTTGRLVIYGSHPEGVDSGERLKLTAGVLRYALDGQGEPRIKGDLINKAPRIMNDNNRVGFEKIGDLQYHHFSIPVSKTADSIVISLKSGAGYDFNLYAAFGAPAFASAAPYKDTSTARNKKIIIKNAKPGIWYVGVKCITTIKAEALSHGYNYTDPENVLNGGSYEIMASGFVSPTSSSFVSHSTAKETRFTAVRTHLGINFHFHATSSSDYRLSLVDISGQTVWQHRITSSALSGSGFQSLSVDAKVPSGLMFAVLESDRVREIKRIAIPK